MYLGHLICLVLVGLAFCVCDVRSGDAEIKIVTSGYCSHEILRSKGINATNYKPKFIFDPKQITTIPAKPVVPGCFRLVAKNVTLTEKVAQVTGEFEMRIAGSADPTKPVLQCKKRQPKCGCGEKDTCMYCDFCKNFKNFVHEGEVNHNEINMDKVPGTCECNVPAASYSIDVEVCTPDEDELAQNVPTEVLGKVADGTDFSLFTTLYIYDFRFNSLGLDNTPAAKTALKTRKAKGLVGCYIIGSNVSV